MHTKALCYRDDYTTSWKVYVPEVGWRKVSQSAYTCPHWRGPHGNRPPTGKGLRGRISLAGKQTKINFVPSTPATVGRECEGELTLNA